MPSREVIAAAVAAGAALAVWFFLRRSAGDAKKIDAAAGEKTTDNALAEKPSPKDPLAAAGKAAAEKAAENAAENAAEKAAFLRQKAAEIEAAKKMAAEEVAAAKAAAEKAAAEELAAGKAAAEQAASVSETLVTPEVFEDRIKRLVEEAIDDANVQVENEGGNCSGAKIAIKCVSPVFGGMKRLARQRRVNDALKPLLDSGEIHALTLNLKTPEEARA
jgi:colicin import membrane protein